MSSLVKHLQGRGYIGCIGDSKTAGINSWPYSLCSYLEGRSRKLWGVALHHAVGGWTVADALSGLSTALDATTNVPSYVMIDLGTNEANDSPFPTESVWKADYANLLDQIHAKWPNASILVAKVWRIGYDSQCDTLNGWIDAVIAEGRSSWVSVAFDEGDWLPSWTLDGTHPDSRIGGYGEMARQWFSAIIGS